MFAITMEEKIYPKEAQVFIEDLNWNNFGIKLISTIRKFIDEK